MSAEAIGFACLILVLIGLLFFYGWYTRNMFCVGLGFDGYVERDGTCYCQYGNPPQYVAVDEIGAAWWDSVGEEVE